MSSASTIPDPSPANGYPASIHGLDANLAAYPLPQVERILKDGTISALNAANLINDLAEAQAVGLQTSKTSVRRYRTIHGIEAEAKRVAKVPELDELASPGPVSPWQPKLELGAQGGSFSSASRPSTGRVVMDDQTERELLLGMGLDPDQWQVVRPTAKVTRWQQLRRGEDEPRWLEAWRAEVRPRTAQNILDIEAMLARYEAPVAGEGSGIFLLALADQQLGKPDQGGSAVAVETIARTTESVAARIRDEAPGGRAQRIVIALLGDETEGAVSQGGRLAHDLSVTEAVRVAKRLYEHVILTLAPLCDEMIVAAVPSNHGESRRDRAVPVLDNWSIAIPSMVMDSLALAGGYEHVRFVFPAKGDISLTVDAGTPEHPLGVGVFHGHSGAGSADKVPAWIDNQDAGRQPTCGARLYVSGHFHNLQLRDIGAGRWWLMAPAAESGSDWFRHRAGKVAQRGVVSLWLEPESDVPWRDLRMYSGSASR